LLTAGTRMRMLVRLQALRWVERGALSMCHAVYSRRDMAGLTRFA
jgi:hypothetical protein